LSFDGGLAAPIELSQGAQRKADEIFEEEQEFVAQESFTTAPEERTMWVNTQGYGYFYIGLVRLPEPAFYRFLTQTERPGATPYRKPLSQAPAFLATQQLQPSPFAEVPQTSQHPRRPLGTLSFSQVDDPDENTDLQPLRRIRRARTPSPVNTFNRVVSPSPTRVTGDAFSALKVGATRKHRREEKAKRKLGKSTYVEQEADESDEDAAYGFGPRKKDDEDEESDGDEEDKHVEGLVDDAQMDEETVAAQLVVEKFK
jgi:mediator of replication checkpoint protein 1